MGWRVTANASVELRSIPSVRPRLLTTQTVRVLVYIAQMILDIAAIVGGFTIAALIRHRSLQWGADMMALVTLLPVFMVISFYAGAYNYDGVGKREGVNRALTSLALAIAFNILAAFALKNDGEISRIFLFAGAALAAMLLIVVRLTMVYLINNHLKSGFIRRVLVIDDAPIAVPPGFEVIDVADYGVTPCPNDPHALHMISSLLFGADRVAVSSSPEKRENWSLYLKGIGCNGEMLVPELHAIGQLHAADGTTMVGVPVSAGPLNIRARVLKRSFDLLLTVPTIIALTPVFILIAIAIKVTDPGPVLFRQRRMGRGNRLFNVYKFRSMRVEASDHTGARSASRDDDRITPIGRIIRKTSLDELPQLFNVLEGDMSLVGPRPHALGSLAGDELFWHVDRRYWLRHAIKPGITGLAQVRGFRGATDHRDDLMQRLVCELEYAADWSILGDLIILARTVAVLVHKKAY